MCGTRPSTFVLRHLAATSAAAGAGPGRRRLHIVARPRRHGLDALEVNEQVDRTDDQRQRRNHDERQYGRRLEDRVPNGGHRSRRPAGQRPVKLGRRKGLEL